MSINRRLGRDVDDQSQVANPIAAYRMARHGCAQLHITDSVLVSTQAIDTVPVFLFRSHHEDFM